MVCTAMEETTVLVVGAGPSGLALAVSLGRMNIKTVILEKELEVTEDPRGIAIAGDAVRVSHQLGIGDSLVNVIGSDIGILYFHDRTFRHPPFMYFDVRSDNLEQSVSNAICQFQPNFERELRKVLDQQTICDLRVGCEVLGRVEEDAGIVVTYCDQQGKEKKIRTLWLVGADGKRGIVRKKFLEPEGVRQEIGGYDHVSTWVAANFEITLPTPASHPSFPLWDLGYTPEKVYELFWPSGFHFCNDPKRPAVSGRFGPKGLRLWRHEYSVEPDDDITDSVGHLWKQFGSWLEVPGSRISSKLKNITVAFPRHCVTITRCRPFTFSTKVVNRWFIRRTLLIGDAAHVFPPFGGQGIASGIRDAQALSWRLALLSNPSSPIPPAVQERVLTGWAHERRQMCDNATRLTKINGSMTNQRNWLLAFLHRVVIRFLWSIPGVAASITRKAMGDVFKYTDCEGAFFLPDREGGRKLPQIWVTHHGDLDGDEKPELSDAVFLRDIASLGLVVIVRGDEEVDEIGIARILDGTNLPAGLLSLKSVSFLRLPANSRHTSRKAAPSEKEYCPCTADELRSAGIEPIRDYDETTLGRRVGSKARYVLLRPDFYIHSIAANEVQLEENLKEMERYFEVGR